MIRKLSIIKRIFKNIEKIHKYISKEVITIRGGF